MCGIAGYIGKGRIDEQLTRRTLVLMKNRGPDHSDFIVYANNSINVVLLHSRLAIIDLDERANQPFNISNYTLIFNGEIYNYKELRKDLEDKGIEFTTESDTEVLLRSYIEYGESCVDKFEGMWSFAIYNSQNHKLFLSRDRFAEKPLYYTRFGDGIYFASEIKFLKSLSNNKFSINIDQTLNYLINGYKSLYKNNQTFFQEVEELPFATSMIIDASLNVNKWQYWRPEYKPCMMSLSEAIEGVRYHLFESVRLRLRSDVPLAICLSGGVDSASLASIAMKKFNTDIAVFSIIESDERYNEYDNIMATINDLNCKYTLIKIPQEDGLNRLKSLVEYHDVPVATTTFYAHSLLLEAISQSGYKVAFSGTAADEILTGYYDHFILHLYELRNHPNYPNLLYDWQKYILPFVRNSYLRNHQLYFENPNMRKHIFDNSDEFLGYIKKDFKTSFTEYSFCDSLLRNRMLNEIFYECTRVILHEEDLNSMQYSIENRSPYLDSRLFKFAFSIPEEYLIGNGFGKYLLRESMKGILNDTVRLTRQKKGFNASINSIIDFKNKKNREYLLDNSSIFTLIDKAKIKKLIDQYPLSNSYSKFLFNFINTKIFFELNN